ncbi:MAG: sugar ABC transporter permease, partial [Clostridiaceae bacterium]
MAKTPAVKSIPKCNALLNFKKGIKDNYSFYLLLLPGFIVVLLFAYLPIPGIILAFEKYEMISKNFFINLTKCDWIWFDNFWLFFNDPNFLNALRNTVVYNIFFMITG